jgi:hypothetical protein
MGNTSTTPKMATFLILALNVGYRVVSK